MKASEVKKAYADAFPYLMTPVECKDRIYEPIQIEDAKDILLNFCHRHRQMVFTEEIADCDDFVLQAYADFKWTWSKLNTNNQLSGVIKFKRKYKAHAPIGMAFGIKFRNRMVKHSVVTILAEEMFIYDAIQRDFYVTDPDLDIVLNVSMQ